MPKSIPHLELDKVRQVLVSEVLNSNVLAQNVHSKSLSQELNNVLFCKTVVVKMNRFSFVIKCVVVFLPCEYRDFDFVRMKETVTEILAGCL